MKPQASNGHPRSVQAVREDAERLHIDQTWNSDGFNVMRTARHLGITARSLYAKLKRYGLARPNGGA